MKHPSPIPTALAALGVAILCAGCVSFENPNAKKKPEILWSTLEPSRVIPSERVKAAGPFQLRLFPSLAILNFDEDYKGDDAPWIDRSEGFRERVADAMDGYDPAAVTLADVAVARNSFLRERLGDDYIWKEKGRDGKYVGIVGGKKWESEKKYFAIQRLGMFPEAIAKENARKFVDVRIVTDGYGHRKMPTSKMIDDKTVYLFGMPGDGSIPKISFTELPDSLARALAVEGSEREVPGGTAMEVETPRGRITVYKPHDKPWEANGGHTGTDQSTWNVGVALMRLLNGLPDDLLQKLPDNHE